MAELIWGAGAGDLSALADIWVERLSHAVK